MKIYHFVYTQPGPRPFVPGAIMDYYCAALDDRIAEDKFNVFSGHLPYNTLTVYDKNLDDEVAKDVMHFAYYTHDVPEDADNLVVAALTQNPTAATDELIFEACQCDAPKSLRMLLRLLHHTPIQTRWLREAARWGHMDNVRVLLEDGRVKDDGSALAAACDGGNRAIFERLLAVSDPQIALELYLPQKNKIWLEEIVQAQHQKQKLTEAVTDGLSPRTRKI